LSIVIAGAGIGGPAAAVSMHEAGRRDARVFERVAGHGARVVCGPASPALSARRPGARNDPTA
jgi:2-polyprenyl-6-methoxyphenol hydroxylase-like FAD-dependent oxidoreductase